MVAPTTAAAAQGGLAAAEQHEPRKPPQPPHPPPPPPPPPHTLYHHHRKVSGSGECGAACAAGAASAAAPLTLAEWARGAQQRRLRALGRLIASHAGKVLFIALLILACFCVGLKNAQLHSKVEQLWVQEGGRLSSELRYAELALGEPPSSTHQMLAQTVSGPLDADALLAHLRVLRAAADVRVHRFDATWRLHDLCYGPAVPDFDAHYAARIFEGLLPCAIVTPLDCFWEGSKLLGPEFPVRIPGRDEPLRWATLHPAQLVREMRRGHYDFPFGALESFLRRAGVTSGYLDKPCLDREDGECPSRNETGPRRPDVAAALAGGCYGFAAEHMHWPEPLVVGGARRDRSGALRGAAALMSVVQLMAERELFEFWQDTYKVHHVSWTQDKAAAVLHDWQKLFAEEVKKIMAADSLNSTETKSHKFYTFSTATLNDILHRFSSLNLTNIIVGFGFMLVYVVVCSMRWYDPVMSQVGVGISGVALLVASVAAGLGFCAILGIPFNASSTQVVPFAALGLGVNDMFTVLGVRWRRSAVRSSGGALLCQAAPAVLRCALSNVVSFFAAALIPVPALRVFCLQMAILLLFTLAVVLLVFPAIVSLDERRRSSGRADIACCILPDQPLESVTVYQRSKLTVSDKEKQAEAENELLNRIDTSCHRPWCRTFSLDYLIETYYAPFIMKTTIKMTVIIGLVAVLAASLWGSLKVADGLDLMDIVPADSDEHKFLDIQEKYFGFYNMYAVTQGDFEYPTNQKFLYEYHDAFVKVPNIVKNDDGGMPEFWLSLFRDWLISLQRAFDKDFENGCINQETWFPNATEDGILAYKLLVQTGHVDNPVDKLLISQVKLVDSEGIINPKAFYNYLSAWVSLDVFAYGASQANLRPEPKRWFHSPKDFELKIPKSSPLIYAQMPFYLSGLSDTADIKALITAVRNICDRFEAKGLTNFPSGIPFLFWEQYMYLRPTLVMALACAFAAVFLVLLITTCNFWVSLICILIIACSVLRLFGLMALLEVKLSAASAVMLIASVGLGVHYVSIICVEFVAPVGDGESGKRANRARRALVVGGGAAVRGFAAAALAAAALHASPFSFAARLARLVLAFAGGGLCDGLAAAPALLALLGPAAERRAPPPRRRRRAPPPASDASSGAAPPPSPPPRDSSSASPSPRPRRPPSLTTIAEESPSWRSSQASHSHSSRSARGSLQSILLQPELVVETTTTTTPSPSPADGAAAGAQPANVTTKVTATANIKVELHSSDPERRRRRRERDERRRDSGHDSDRSRRS